ncbi:hypothetical protein Tco_1525050 [Tanacetum coccineum]
MRRNLKASYYHELGRETHFTPRSIERNPLYRLKRSRTRDLFVRFLPTPLRPLDQWRLRFPVIFSLFFLAAAGVAFLILLAKIFGSRSTALPHSDSHPRKKRKTQILRHGYNYKKKNNRIRNLGNSHCDGHPATEKQTARNTRNITWLGGQSETSALIKNISWC